MNPEDYAITPIEKEGVFRAFPIAWTIEPSTSEGSQSVAIAFRFAVHQEWAGKESGWSQEWPAGYFTENRTYVVKRDGTLNQGAIDALAKCGLWDGDWDRLEGPVPSVFVLLDVGAETYEGKTRYRANWVNPNADEPAARGGFSPVDTSLVAKLRSKFQSQTKAIAHGAPSGQPPAPPAAAAAPPAAAQPAAAGAPATHPAPIVGGGGQARPPQVAGPPAGAAPPRPPGPPTANPPAQGQAWMPPTGQQPLDDPNDPPF